MLTTRECKLRNISMHRHPYIGAVPAPKLTSPKHWFGVSRGGCTSMQTRLFFRMRLLNLSG